MNNTRTVFVEDVQLSGYWGGSCVGCKWKDYGAQYLFADCDKAKYHPTDLVLLPCGVIEEVED